jgi:hypothetical protein
VAGHTTACGDFRHSESACEFASALAAHPQTQRKAERLHRTLKLELIDRTGFNSLPNCQRAFNCWRDQHNLIGPRGALNQKPQAPATPLARVFPEELPAIEDDKGVRVIKVCKSGRIQFNRRCFRIGEDSLNSPLLFVLPGDGVYNVFCCEPQG